MKYFIKFEKQFMDKVRNTLKWAVTSEFLKKNFKNLDQ